MGSAAIGRSLAAAALVLLAATGVAAQDAPVRPPADTVSSSVILAQHRGAEAARYASTTRWVFGGFMGGLTLGPIGAGLAYVLANNSDTEVPVERWRLLTQEVNLEYAEAYQRSFAETLHARRKSAALKGGVIGTAALAVTATAIWAIYYYY